MAEKIQQDNQELLLRASFFEKQAQEIQERLNLVEQQIAELEAFSHYLKYIDSADESSMLAGLGRGIYLKTELKEKKLFVNAGANIVVRKTPEQAQEIILEQLKTFAEARATLREQFEIYSQHLQEIISQIEEQEKIS